MTPPRKKLIEVALPLAAIGPGMAVFSRYARVLEADGTATTVRAALAEINRVLDETLAETEGEMDERTRFCVAWFEQYGMAARPYGEAEVLFTAKNTTSQGLEDTGVVQIDGGKLRLKGCGELERGWNPAAERRPVDWLCTQHLARTLTAEDGGGVAEAAQLAAAMGAGRADRARALAYRLFTAAERKGWTEEARAWNALAASWPEIWAEAAKLAEGGPAQRKLMPADRE